MFRAGGMVEVVTSMRKAAPHFPLSAARPTNIPDLRTEPVFLNVYGAQESIPRNEFRQPYVTWRAGTITLFLLGS